MSFQLRSLKANDVHFIASLYQDPAVMHHIGPTLSDEQVTNMVRQMLSEVENQRAIYQIIETAEEQQPAGMLSMHWYPDHLSIESGMIVAPGFQNQGLCKWAQMSAMQAVKSVFPAKLCTVYISQNNVAANRSYQNMGFISAENQSTLKRHLNLNRWDFDMEQL